MSVSRQPWTIVGQGLAGTCLAWQLWQRGAPFNIVDAEENGSSRVAAGLINPVTGKNFQPSARIAEYLPEALAFYQKIAGTLDTPLWHPLPILRLAANEVEWAKIQAKSALPEVIPWLAGGDGGPRPFPGWHGAIELNGGGRLDTRAFLDQSREFFATRGAYQKLRLRSDDPAPGLIWCDGAAGLMSGRHGPHRCAKGEILTLRAPAWDSGHVRVGAGGWLVPLGAGVFKAGATYQWDKLDSRPSAAGMQTVQRIASLLGGDNSFEIIAHEAAVRPILRRSEALIGPYGNGQWMFNGLGSKGSLYAPGMARRLAEWLLDESATSSCHGYGTL